MVRRLAYGQTLFSSQGPQRGGALTVVSLPCPSVKLVLPPSSPVEEGSGSEPSLCKVPLSSPQSPSISIVIVP